jgi:hypothetical protein
MSNQYLDRIINSESNHFSDVFKSENPDISGFQKIASNFHEFQSIMNDPSVSEENKQSLFAEWGQFTGETDFTEEEKSQIDNFLIPHMIEVNPEDPQHNILKYANDDMKVDLFTSVYDEVEAGNTDVIINLTKAYSKFYDKKLSFNEDNNIDPETLGMIGETLDDNEIDVEGTQPDVSDLEMMLENQTPENRDLMLLSFIKLAADIKRNNDVTPDIIEEFDNVSQEIQEILKNDGVENLNTEDISLNDQADTVKEPGAMEDTKNIEANPNEITVDAKEDALKRYNSIMKEHNIVKKTSIPLINSELYYFDPELGEDMASGLGKGMSIGKVNNFTGTIKLTPAAFDDSNAHSLLAAHARSSGWETVAIAPPKKGTPTDKKTFMKNAIVAMYNEGGYECDQIKVPQKWVKFRDALIDNMNEAKLMNTENMTATELEEFNKIDADIPDNDLTAAPDPDISPASENVVDETVEENIDQTVEENIAPPDQTQVEPENVSVDSHDLTGYDIDTSSVAEELGDSAPEGWNHGLDDTSLEENNDMFGADAFRNEINDESNVQDNTENNIDYSHIDFESLPDDHIPDNNEPEQQQNRQVQRRNSKHKP